MAMGERGLDFEPAAWERTSADENRRYREDVFGTRLARAAAAADVLASRLVERPAGAAEIEARISALQSHMQSQIDALTSWTERQHSAYLMPVTWPGVERGRELVLLLDGLLDAAKKRDELNVRKEAAAVKRVAQILSEGALNPADQ